MPLSGSVYLKTTGPEIAHRETPKILMISGGNTDFGI
jgi:hypothetical protein